jgi:undecaprenyl-diphosphatase
VSWLEAIVLGIAQGLTEFLPISSTAHLRIVPAFAGWEDPGALFTAVVQLGTMLAVVIYFWQDLVRITRAWLLSLRQPQRRRDLDARMASHLLTSSVSTRTRGIDDVNRWDAIWVGLAQALALVPGTSRSGATITAGLFRGMRREAAARFSFLLSIPAVVLSGLYGLVELITGDNETSFGALAVATLFAFLLGYASIAFLLRYLANHSTLIFVVYRVILGAVVIALTASGTIS